MIRKILLSILIVLTAFLIYTISEKNFPYLDHQADTYFSEITSEAAVAYATVRGVNAVISVLKESQIEFSPAGVGINIAAGQVLDPIDDMTERLSSVIVTALVSLGLQKLVMELTKVVPMKCAAFVLMFTLLFIWIPVSGTGSIVVLSKACTLLLMLRLILPISSIVNDSLYNHLFKESISESAKELSLLSEKYDQLSRIDINSEEGLLPSFTQTAKEKLIRTKMLFNQISANMDTIIDSLLDLTVFYISLFVLQVIIIPVGMLWLLILLINSFFRSQFFPMAITIPRIIIDKQNNTKLIQKE